MKSNRSILFVEDDAVVLTTYRNLLLREGFRVESAGDGLEALKALSQATPELIVLDLMLPKFDGADVLKFIRADPRLKTIPIIIFSNAQVTDFTEDAITKHLRKSDCTPSILLKTIQEMLTGTATDASDGANATPTQSEPAIKLHMAGEGWPRHKPMTQPRPKPWVQVGGILPIVIALAAIVGLPESIKYMALHESQRPRMVRLIAVLRPGFAVPANARFVIEDEKQSPSSNPLYLFGDGLWLITPLSWLLFALNLMGYFFLSGWTPTLLTAAKLPPTTAALAAHSCKSAAPSAH